MQYPALVYKFTKTSPGYQLTPGQHSCKGGHFESAGVTNLDEHIAKLEDGWSYGLDDAMSDKDQAVHVERMRAERQQARAESARAKKEEAERLQREIEEDERAAQAAKKRADDDELKRMEAEERKAADDAAKASSKTTIHINKK